MPYINNNHPFESEAQRLAKNGSSYQSLYGDNRLPNVQRYDMNRVLLLSTIILSERNFPSEIACHIVELLYTSDNDNLQEASKSILKECVIKGLSRINSPEAALRKAEAVLRRAAESRRIAARAARNSNHTSRSARASSQYIYTYLL